MTSIAIKPTTTWHWLRSPSFDLGLILGVTTVALLSGAAVVRSPALFGYILSADLWLLGYHHVIATFTRITFDRESFRRYGYLVTWVPLLVIAGVLVIARTIGLWPIASIYLYWQWFHYTRQSYGIAQMYRRKAGGLVTESGLPFKASFYLLPLWGILRRSAQAPAAFLGVPLKVIPVSPIVVEVAGIAAIASLLWWAWQKLQQYRAGRLPVVHTMFMLTHYTIFGVGYLVIDNIDFGWLTLNIWHNAQYLLFVWMANNQRFKDRVDPEHRVLSTLCQRKYILPYFLTTLLISSTVYWALQSVLTTYALAVFAIPLYLVLFQIVNFHHYIVDAVIWRSRRRGTAAPTLLPDPIPH